MGTTGAAADAQLAQLGEPDPGAAGRLEEIVLSADAAGLSWLSRVARGLQAVQLLMTDPAPWRVATCADLVRDCERYGDRWATCLLAGVVGFAYAQVGQEDEAGVPAAPRRRRGGCTRQCWRSGPPPSRWTSAYERGARRAGRAAAVRRRAERLGAVGVTGMLLAASPRRVPSSAGDSSIRLTCLGAFRLTVGGRPVAGPPCARGHARC